MSSLRPDLQIKVVVAGAQPERLNPILQAIKQAGDATIRQAKALGDVNAVYRESIRLSELFADKGAQIASANYFAKALGALKDINAELAKLNQQPVNLQEKLDVRSTKSSVNQASLLKDAGDYAGALRVLQDQLGKVSAQGDSWYKIQSQITRVQAAATAASGTHERAIASEAIAQGKLARAAGDFAQEQQILGAALGRVTDGGKAASTIQLALAKSQDVTTAAGERMNNSLSRRAILESRVAISSGDHAKALGILNAALPKLQQGSDAYLRVQEKINQVQGELNSKPGFLATAGEGVGDIVTGMTRAVAVTFLWIYALKQVGSVIDSAILDPVNQTLAKVLTTTDEFRKLEITLSGVLGSRGAAVGLRNDIASAGGSLPSTLLEQQGAVRGLAYTPQIAASLQLLAGRQERLNSILTTLQGLAVINPEQGLEGAQFATREALAGQFRSLRTRFNVSPDVIASTIGKTQADLRSNPDLVLPALKAFVDTFIGPDTIKELSTLLSAQGRLFKGNIEEFFNLIGDQGIYDRVTRILQGFNSKLRDAVRGGDGDVLQAATTISDALDRVIDSILNGASSVISGITGKNVDLKQSLETGDIGTLAKVVADLIDSLSKLSASIYLLIGDILGAAGKLANALGITGTQTAAETQAAITKRQGTLAGLQSTRSTIANRAPVSTLNKGLDQLGNEAIASVYAKFGEFNSQYTSASDLGLIDRSIDNEKAELARLGRRLALQNIVEGSASTREALERSPDFVGPPAPAAGASQFSNPGNELKQELLQAALGTQDRIDRIFDTTDSNTSLPKKVEELNDAIIKLYDPTVSGSVGDLLAKAAGFTGEGKDSVAVGVKAVRGALDKVFQDARSDILKEASKEIGKASPLTQERQGGELISSIYDLARVSSGFDASQLKVGGISLLSALPKDLQPGNNAKLLPKREDIDNLVPVIRDYAKARVDLGHAVQSDLDDLIASLRDVKARYGQADSIARFGAGDVGIIQDRLQGSIQDVVKTFGQGFLRQGNLEQSSVNNSIDRASDAATLFERRVKNISGSPDALDAKIKNLDDLLGQTLDPKSPGSLGSYLDDASAANKTFAQRFAPIADSLRDVQRNLSDSVDDKELSQHIDEFLKTPAKLQDAVDKLVTSIDSRVDAATLALVQKSTAGFTRQATAADRGIKDANSQLSDLEKIFSQPHDITENIAEFASKARDVFDPSKPGSVSAILAQASTTTQSLEDQMKAAKGPLQDLLVKLKDSPEGAGLRASIQELIQQPALLFKALTDSIKHQNEAFQNARSAAFKGILAGEPAPLTTVRRGGEALDQLDFLLGAANGGPTQFVGPRQPGLDFTGLVKPGTQPGFNPDILPRPEDIAGLGKVFQDMADAAVNTGQATDSLEARVLGFFQRLKQDYESQDVQKVFGTDVAQKVADQIDLITANLSDRFKDRFKSLREVIGQFNSEVSSDIKTGVVDVLVDAFDQGADSISQTINNLGKSLEKALFNAIVEMTLIQGLLNPALNYAFYGAANPTVGAGGPPVPGALKTVGWTPTPVPVPGKATGDYFPGSLHPLGAATGILSRPGLVRTVEDGIPEAIVPIGRGGVPVRWIGQRRDPVTIHTTNINVVDSADLVTRGLARRPNTVVNLVNQDMRQTGVTARTVKMTVNR